VGILNNGWGNGSGTTVIKCEKSANIMYDRGELCNDLHDKLVTILLLYCIITIGGSPSGQFKGL
jgi:hypothetical protein